MASLNVRGGEPTNLNAAPYITTAGVVNTSARVINLQQGSVNHYCRPVYIQNLDGTNALFVKINDNDASATDCHIRIAANGFHLVENINVTSLSLFMTAGDYATAMVHGWKP